jgi:uncharacterized protein YPO0396
MKVIWLRKQYEAYKEVESLSPYTEAVNQLHTYAVHLKQYVRKNPEAIRALDTLEQLVPQLSEAIKEGNFDRVKELASEAAKYRSIIANAVPDDDYARDFYQKMSDAIRALGGY